MGQAFRRASGRIRTPAADPTPSPSPSYQLKKTVDRVQPVAPLDDEVSGGPSSSDGATKKIIENVLEEKDPQFDAMLNKMVGRIQTKPGGKLEMGEASVVENYKRPLPKLRNTTPDSGRYEDVPAPQGTLNVKQLRHLILLHEGKADDQSGPMDIHQITEKFRVDITQIQKILQSLSLPPEENSRQKKNPQ